MKLPRRKFVYLAAGAAALPVVPRIAFAQAYPARPAAKRVEIAREAFPRATVLGIAFDTISREQGEAAAEAARKLGLEPRVIEVKGPQDYGGAFNAIASNVIDDARGQSARVHHSSRRRGRVANCGTRAAV